MHVHVGAGFFAVTPVLISLYFGLTDLGTKLSILTLAPAIGSFGFSMALLPPITWHNSILMIMIMKLSNHIFIISIRLFCWLPLWQRDILYAVFYFHPLPPPKLLQVQDLYIYIYIYILYHNFVLLNSCSRWRWRGALFWRQVLEFQLHGDGQSVHHGLCHRFCACAKKKTLPALTKETKQEQKRKKKQQKKKRIVVRKWDNIQTHERTNERLTKDYTMYDFLNL